MSESNIPVLILIFNRPEKTRVLLDALAAVRPRFLYIAADGPRIGVPSDSEKCALARAIAQDIAWPCTVQTLFSAENLGVDPAVEHGIDWFFSHVDKGIILEDDCIPHPDFFRFAGTMLERYQNDTRVMMISGNSFAPRQLGDDDTFYYFSHYPTMWGWATWRRAWEHYDSDLCSFPKFETEGKIQSIRPSRDEQRYWMRYFRSLYEKKRVSWDVKWIFALWNRKAVSIAPRVNLVQNIGFGKDATHTFGSSKTQSIVSSPIGSLNRLPPKETDEESDRQVFETMYKLRLNKMLVYACGRIVRVLGR